MSVAAFDHVNIRTGRLEDMVAFYTEVLGLAVGDRPPFGFAGAWLYLDGQAVIHLVQDRGRIEAPEPRIEHVAFRGAGRLKPFLDKLASHGIDWRLGEVPDWGITQVNLHDPDGNHLHVDFQEPMP